MRGVNPQPFAHQRAAKRTQLECRRGRDGDVETVGEEEFLQQPYGVNNVSADAENRLSRPVVVVIVAVARRRGRLDDRGQLVEVLREIAEMRVVIDSGIAGDFDELRFEDLRPDVVGAVVHLKDRVSESLFEPSVERVVENPALRDGVRLDVLARMLGAAREPDARSLRNGVAENAFFDDLFGHAFVELSREGVKEVRVDVYEVSQRHSIIGHPCRGAPHRPSLAASGTALRTPRTISFARRLAL